MSGRGFKCIVISTLYLKDRGCFFAFTLAVGIVAFFGYCACGNGCCLCRKVVDIAAARIAAIIKSNTLRHRVRAGAKPQIGKAA